MKVTHSVCMLALLLAACSPATHNGGDLSQQQVGSGPAASDSMAKLGFGYLFQRHDPATAMKRFNQARLLDPQNGAAYQGMAITTLIQDPSATAQADGLFQRALASSRKNPAIFADYGRFLLQERRFGEAVPVLQQGAAMDANYPETNSLLATALYQNGQKREACPLARQWQTRAQPEVASLLTAIIADPACQS